MPGIGGGAVDVGGAQRRMGGRIGVRIRGADAAVGGDLPAGVPGMGIALVGSSLIALPRPRVRAVPDAVSRTERAGEPQTRSRRMGRWVTPSQS